MKQFVSGLFLLLLIGNAKAQEAVDSVAKKPNTFESSYAVKINPASIPLGKIGLFGEYNFKRKRSVTLGIGIPMEMTTTRTIDDEKESVSMKTFSVMGGYRMYMGKKTMAGLYFEPYLKYVSNETSSQYVGEGTINTTTYLLRSDYSGAGIGAQLGAQFVIAKRIVLDLFFLGPEANISNWTISVQDKSPGTWTPIDEQEARDQVDVLIEDLPSFIRDNIETTVDTNAKTVKANLEGFLPGLRFGLSVGIRF